MSPEQFWDSLLTSFSDYYSLGVIWYELLMGCLPFMADDYPIGQSHRQQARAFLCPNHQLSEFACQVLPLLTSCWQNAWKKTVLITWQILSMR